MKVLLINGSPHAKGSTYTALHEMEKVFTENGIEAEIVHIGNKDIRGCVACGACSKPVSYTHLCFDIVRMGFHNRIRVSGDHQDTHQGFRIKDASSYFYVNVVIQAFHHIYKFFYTLYFIKL